DSGMGGDQGGSLGGDNGQGSAMVSGATQTRRQQQAGQGNVAFTTSEGVRIAAVNENNQLLIRATPGQWEKLLPVIQRLDEKPLQVQIETKVLEVNLTGEFQFGVQYYLGGLIGTQPGSPPNTNESYHRHQGAAGMGGVDYNPLTDALFYSFAGKNLQFALKALQTSGDAKVLSAPSTVVLNNQETTFKVGEKIPVVQNYYLGATGIGSPTGESSVGQVQYIDTGVLLDVVPRVSPGGLVYLDVQQVVSKPSATTDKYGNYTISNRALSTEVAVQSGQTVLLGGLIQQTDSVQDNGVPFLSRVPVLGHLFGTTDRNRARTELIVLITPRIIRNPEDARRTTDEYETQFESLKPILPGGSAAAPAAATTPVAPPSEPAETIPASVPPAATVQPGGWAVAVAAFTEQSSADALRTRLQQLGFASYVDSAPGANGTLWRVRAGPVISQSAAELLQNAISGSLHISGMQVIRR
ncbi:MAG TPA: SPOR domain-containing protein, partial [Rhodanobacteraceae bacterium]